jgi:hypothetical protein
VTFESFLAKSLPGLRARATPSHSSRGDAALRIAYWLFRKENLTILRGHFTITGERGHRTEEVVMMLKALILAVVAALVVAAPASAQSELGDQEAVYEGDVNLGESPPTTLYPSCSLDGGGGDPVASRRLSVASEASVYCPDGSWVRCRTVTAYRYGSTPSASTCGGTTTRSSSATTVAASPAQIREGGPGSPVGRSCGTSRVTSVGPVRPTAHPAAGRTRERGISRRGRRASFKRARSTPGLARRGFRGWT